MDWMDFNHDGEVDAAEDFFAEEMLWGFRGWNWGSWVR